MHHARPHLTAACLAADTVLALDGLCSRVGEAHCDTCAAGMASACTTCLFPDSQHRKEQTLSFLTVLLTSHLSPPCPGRVQVSPDGQGPGCRPRQPCCQRSREGIQEGCRRGLGALRRGVSCPDAQTWALVYLPIRLPRVGEGGSHHSLKNLHTD